jgi:hypothetical protein
MSVKKLFLLIAILACSKVNLAFKIKFQPNLSLGPGLGGQPLLVDTSGSGSGAFGSAHDYPVQMVRPENLQYVQPEQNDSAWNALIE